MFPFQKRHFSNWMKRHVNDPYVKKSVKEGFRSRSAYKLIEINEKFHIFSNVKSVIDLGAAPGGWSQVLSRSLNCSKILSIDLLPISPINGCEVLKLDLRQEKSLQMIKEKGQVDLVLSDMSPNRSGDGDLDSLEITELNEAVLQLSLDVLNNKGSIVMKTLMCDQEKELFLKISKFFQKVERFKPKSSRKESREFYYVALHKLPY